MILTRQQDVVDLKRTQRNDAADHAGATDGRRRTFLDNDAPDQLRIEKDRAHGTMARLLEILARAVDIHVDAALLLQTSNINRGAGTLPVAGGPHAGHVLEQIAAVAWRSLLECFAANDAHGRWRLVNPIRRALIPLVLAIAGGANIDGIEGDLRGSLRHARRQSGRAERPQR